MNVNKAKTAGLLITAATMVAAGVLMSYDEIVKGRAERIKIGKQAEADLKSIAYATEIIHEELVAGHYRGHSAQEILGDLDFIAKMNDPKYS